ncbi:MAG: hypothetical protein U0Q22_05855 [Acidimicrobiales bacterium]
MARRVACAVLRDESPIVFVAEDEATLNWLLALRLIAQTPGHRLSEGFRDELRAALREERWGDAVSMWVIHEDAELDVDPSLTFFETSDAELAADELQFTPLFRD